MVVEFLNYNLMSNKTGNTIAALLIGAALGAVAGILFAPDKGSKTRSKIKDRFDDLKDTFENTSEQIKEKVSNSKFDLEETYDDLVSNMSHKTEDVISFLETKLADLKKENAKFQK
jgi:gas vesicle protein